MAAQTIELAALASRSADGVSASLDLADHGVLRLALTITANSCQAPLAGNQLPPDAPAFQLRIEHSPDNATWRELLAQPEANERAVRFNAGPVIRVERRTFAGCERYVRARWHISGQSPITFAVDGHAV